MVKSTASFSNDPKLKSNQHKNNSVPSGIMGKPILLGLLSFVILSALFAALIYQRFAIVRESKNKQSYELLNKAKDKIQDAIAYSISATKTLSFFIDHDGNVHEFDSISAQIIHAIPGIDALELVPDGIIKFIYPLQGNEVAIGYNILKDPTRNKEAFKAIERKEMFFAGPFQLKQGGMAVVGRLPVYRNNKFWGFSAVIIKLSTLFDIADIDSSGKTGYYFQLSKTNPDTELEEYFLPVREENLQSSSITVKVPDGEWKLSVTNSNFYNGFGDIILLSILGLVLCVMAAVMVYRIAIRPKKLNNLVKMRTAELKNSENKYRSLIERVSDAFVSLDNDWNYTYVNRRAGEIFSREPESLVGKNIWKEFPEGINQPFYDTYYSARETQEYHYLEEYYPPYDKWFENHIYPSNDGITIFFKDVTEIKKAQIALKNNEEKYRSLIEQASDGIVITNMDGEIIEVNNSIKQMIGFDEEELIGHHITEYLPEDDMEVIPIRIKDLMEGKSLLYERRLRKKDGTILDVEVNSRMASTHTLIGFLRDITERKKAALELKKSKERFELIAEATSDVIWDHDFISNKTWGNNNLYGLYGIEPGSATITFEMFFNQIHPEDKGGIKLRLDKAIEARVSYVTEQFRFKVADGKYRIFNDSAHIKYDDKGNPIRILGAMMDITEREEAQKTIRESEEKFRTIVEQASDGIFIADVDTRFIDVNTSGCQITGYSLEELKQMKIIDLIPEEDIKTNPVQVTKLKSGESIVNERRLKRKDGILIDVEISAKVLPDGRFQSIARDITKRKKADEILYQSEQKYKLLFYDNPLPMWMTTIPELDIIDVNESAIRKYGYSREEFLKLNAKDMRPAEDVPYFLSEVEKMLPNKNNTRQWRHKKKDGTLINVEIFSHEIVYEGKRVWLGLSHDVTEKYEAKELLQKSYEDIRQLASNLQSIREDERTSIAREIHDELGQQLTGLKMDLHWLTRKINSSDEQVAAKMQESIKLIDATIASVRKISTDLRPSILDDLGLIPALEWQGEEFEKRSGIAVEFINNAGERSVQPEVATAIFRIYQELLTNIARHANASQVKAELTMDKSQLYFRLTDNGIGFNPELIKNKKTLGLLGIKERSLLLGGTYEFESAPGKGSVTSISIPITSI